MLFGLPGIISVARFDSCRTVFLVHISTAGTLRNVPKSLPQVLACVFSGTGLYSVVVGVGATLGACLVPAVGFEAPVIEALLRDKQSVGTAIRSQLQPAWDCTMHIYASLAALRRVMTSCRSFQCKILPSWRPQTRFTRAPGSWLCYCGWGGSLCSEAKVKSGQRWYGLPHWGTY